MARRERNKAISLADRRCSKCRRGVAQGAEFRFRPNGGPNSYFPVCRECDRADCLVRARRRRGSPLAEPVAPSVVQHFEPNPTLAASMRYQAFVYRVLAKDAVDPVNQRRCLRAVRDYERLAQLADEGKSDGESAAA